MDEQAPTRQQPPPHDGRALVVGFDRHSASHAALRFAMGLAEQLGARLHVVHVLDLEDTPIDADEDGESWSRHIGRELERSQEEVRQILGASSVGWAYHRRSGDPANQLVAAAEDLDALMIVVGSPPRGLRTALDHILGGAVVEELFHRSSRPVVLVPDKHMG